MLREGIAATGWPQQSTTRWRAPLAEYSRRSHCIRWILYEHDCKARRCLLPSAFLCFVGVIPQLGSRALVHAVGAAAGGDDSFADLFAHASGSLRGFLELYLGLKENVVTVGASNGLYFFLYNVLKDEAARRKLDGTALSLVIAYVAGALNATLTCPLWTVSTRMKLERGRAGAPGIPQPKRSAGMIGKCNSAALALLLLSFVRIGCWT